MLIESFPGHTFLVGLIEKYSGKMVIKIVPNRQINTIKNLIQKHVKIGRLIITDGYPSYPTAIKRSPIYKVVDYSVGFKNEYGYTTNNIEKISTQLKYYKKKKLLFYVRMLIPFWKNSDSEISI